MAPSPALLKRTFVDALGALWYPVGMAYCTSGRRAGRWAGFLLAIVAVTASTGCKEHPPRSAEEAYLKLLDACKSDDGALLFDALATTTKWSVSTAHKSQQEIRQLVIETYPADKRDRALARIPDAANQPLSRPRRYYRHLSSTNAERDAICKRIYAGSGQPIGTVKNKPGLAEVWRAGGSVFHFTRDEDGIWGFVELDDQWKRDAERATHQLEQVRDNARVYRRLARNREERP